jgi:hypothetical protein
VVEHSIGNGEVDSSILSGSTSRSKIISRPKDTCAFAACDRGDMGHASATFGISSRELIEAIFCRRYLRAACCVTREKN